MENKRQRNRSRVESRCSVYNSEAEFLKNHGLSTVLRQSYTEHAISEGHVGMLIPNHSIHSVVHYNNHETSKNPVISAVPTSPCSVYICFSGR